MPAHDDASRFGPASNQRCAQRVEPADPPPTDEFDWRAESATAQRTHPGAWFVERRPDGATWQPRIQQADVTVTGPAQSLRLALTRRDPLTNREASNISIAGDLDVAQHWIDNTAHVSG